jgi:chromatin remodeling complex protein RSC6
MFSIIRTTVSSHGSSFLPTKVPQNTVTTMKQIYRLKGTFTLAPQLAIFVGSSNATKETATKMVGYALFLHKVTPPVNFTPLNFCVLRLSQQIMDYIVQNKLFNPLNKREIFADDKLQTVVGAEKVALFDVSIISSHIHSVITLKYCCLLFSIGAEIT